MWRPRYGKHVTQIHADGSGWNDCGESSLARYVLEAYPHFGTDGEWQLVKQVLDGSVPVMQLVARIAYLARGTFDNPSNSPTTIEQLQTVLAQYGVKNHWVEDFDSAHVAAWSIVLVDGTMLEPATYPPSYFSDPGQANHLILWLPQFHGHDTIFNDPLSVEPDLYTDAEYSLASIQVAFYGALILDDTGAGEDGTPERIIKKACAIKLHPNHGPGVVLFVGAGVPVQVTGQTTPNWTQITFNHHVGWVLTSNLLEPDA